MHILADNSVQLIEVSNKLAVKAVYESFLDNSTTNCTVLGITYLARRDRLVALIEINGRISLVSKTNTKGPRLAFELPPQCGHLSRTFYPACMARSSDEDFVLLAGSDSKDPRMGTAVVHLYKLDDNLLSVDSLTLQEGTQKSMVASCIAKVPERDIFVLGTYTSVFAIQWNGIQLTVLTHFPNQHSCKPS